MNEPVASETTGTSGRGVIPADHSSVTGAFGGKPVPVAITTIPGGPCSGCTSRRARPTVPTRRSVTGSPASLAIRRVATRSPLARPMKVTCSSQAAPGARVVPLQGLSLTKKSSASRPPIVMSPIRAAVIPVLRIVAGRGTPSEPRATDPKSTGFGAAAIRGGRIRTKTSGDASLRSRATRFVASEVKATNWPVAEIEGNML